MVDLLYLSNWLNLTTPRLARGSPWLPLPSSRKCNILQPDFRGSQNRQKWRGELDKCQKGTQLSLIGKKKAFPIRLSFQPLMVSKNIWRDHLNCRVIVMRFLINCCESIFFCQIQQSAFIWQSISIISKENPASKWSAFTYL